MQENPIEAAFASIRAAIGELNAAALWSRADEAALADTRECWELLQALEAAYASMVTDLEGRSLPDGLTTRAFLRSALRRTTAQAAADVRVALNRLPKVGEAFAAGEISRAHLDVITRTVERIPDDLKHRPVPPLPELDPSESTTVIEALDAFLAHHARHHDSYVLQCLAKGILAALNPNDDDGFDPDAYDRRGETHTRDANGMVHGTFNLDAPNGADFAEAVDHFSAPNPKRTETAEDGSTVEIVDARTPAQRRADALGQMARLALNAAHAGTRAGEPPRIVLHTGIDDYHDTHCPETAHTMPPTADPAPAAPEPSIDFEVATPATTTPGTTAPETTGRRSRSRMHGATETHLGAIGPRLLARFACDAVLQVALMHPTGAVLDLGRDARTITIAQRRALTARDRGCVIPGCTAPANWCEGHHVTYWEKGGPTDLDNLALVCGRHHSMIHLGLWELRLSGGLAWARPSRHIDPQRRWLRNTFYDDLDTARGIGTQLRLALRPDDQPAHGRATSGASSTPGAGPPEPDAEPAPAAPHEPAPPHESATPHEAATRHEADAPHEAAAPHEEAVPHEAAAPGGSPDQDSPPGAGCDDDEGSAAPEQAHEPPPAEAA